MQLRRSSVNVASHIAEAHGRLNDAEMRKGLGAAARLINELQTQIELAASLGFFDEPRVRNCSTWALASPN